MDDEITLGYLIDPFEQFQDANGLPIISGIVEVYDEDTENLATIYKDFNQTLQTNPCPTDTLGNVTIIADGTKFYNIIVKDSEGNILLSKNHIKVSNSITETEIINQRAVVLPGEGINVVTTELGNTTNYTVSIDPDYSPINSISGDNGIEVSADGKDYTVYATSGIFSPVNGEYGVYTNIQDMGGGNYRLNVGLNHQGSCQMDGQSIAIGSNTTAIRQGFAHGAQTNAVDYCHAEGLLTTAAGQGTHAEGFTTNSYGYMCHSEGYQTTAGQYYSHAEGDNNRAEAVACHAEGQDTSAVTDYAHTEGYQTKATDGGKYGHAEGMNSIVSGYGAHSEGSYTSACGTCSHAEGHNTLAAAEYSHAGGNNTIASGQYSTVIGKYNNPTLYDIFQIGAGSADDNRINALTVDSSGSVNVNTSAGLKNTRTFFDNVGNVTYNNLRNIPIMACAGTDFDPISTTGATGMYAVSLQTFTIPSAKKVKVDGFYQIKGGMNANGTVPNFAADPKIQTWIIDRTNSSAIEINAASLTNGSNLPRSVPIPFSFVTGGTTSFGIGFCTEGTWTATNMDTYHGATAGNLVINYTTTILDKE